MSWKSKDSNPRDPIDGRYIRNLSANDNYRLRIPDRLIRQLGWDVEDVNKIWISIDEKGKVVIEPYEE